MINVATALVTELNKCNIPVVPDELFANSATSIPCITYTPVANDDIYVGDTMSYARIAFLVKIWVERVEDFYTHAETIDTNLKALGYTREMLGTQKTKEITQYILRYSATGYEN